MATDFTYNNKTINSSGPIKPSGKNQPLDPRTEVKLYADIESIPSPYVGMIITVLEDETNSNKMTDYKVLSLKADSLGVVNSVVDQVQRYVDYLGASSGGSISQEDINTAVNNYLTENPVQSGATAEQAAQIEANRTAIGDANSGLTKEINDVKNVELQNLNTAIQTLETLVGLDETIGDKSGLPSGDKNVIASINRIDSKTLSENNILISPDNSKFKLKVDDSGNLSTEKIIEYGQLILSTEALTINEGGTGTFTVCLDNPPHSSQTVNISCENSYVTVSPESISFNSTNYNSPQTITVTSNKDDNIINDTVNVNITSDNVSSKQVVVTITDIGEASPNTIFDMSDFTIDTGSNVMTLSEDGYYVITNNGEATALPTIKMTNDSKFNILQVNTDYKVKVEVSENTFTGSVRIYNASHMSCLTTTEATPLVTTEYVFKSNSDATENQNRLTNNYIFRFEVPAETGTIKFKIKVLENTI